MDRPARLAGSPAPAAVGRIGERCQRWDASPRRCRSGRVDRAGRERAGAWGPLGREGDLGLVSIAGRSQFPLYRNLGVGIFEMDLLWFRVAAQAPRDGSNPDDPAYHWPADISYAIRHALQYHMQVLLLVEGTPGWANGA